MPDDTRFNPSNERINLNRGRKPGRYSVYIKLPCWFVIKTPIGNYNPDWALIKQEDGDSKKIYFVAETKDPKAVKDRSLLRESERMKIHCGEKHFEEFSDVSFAPVGSVTDIKQPSKQK